MKVFKKLKQNIKDYRQRSKERREERRMKVSQGVKKVKTFTGKKLRTTLFYLHNSIIAFNK